MTTPLKPLTEAQARDADAILSDLEQSVCRDCMGVGSLCWCCGEAFQDCQCEADQEPGPCEYCDGSGTVNSSEADQP